MTQSLQVVAVPVDAFREKISEPSDDQLQAFFEQHKNSIPGYPEPSAIGFLQPRKVQLAYLEAAYLEIEQLVDQVTEEEVEKYYADNKDILFLNRPVPDFSRGELIEPDENTEIPTLELPNPNKPDDSKPNSDESTEDKSPTDSEDTPSKPKGTAPELPKPEVNEDAPSDDTPKEPKQEDEPKQESSRISQSTKLQNVAFLTQEEPKEDTPQPENASEKTAPKDEEKPVEKPTVPPEPEKPSLNVPPAPEAPAKSVPPAPDGPVGEQPLVAEKPRSKYQPLDSALRDRIRDQILNVRTREKQTELADLVYEEMTTLSNEYFQIGTQESNKELTKTQADKARLQFIEEARVELKQLADEHGLTYAETPLLDAREMMNSGDHPIGSAVIGQDPRSEHSQNVTDKMFGGSAESVYEADRAMSLDLNSSFAFWKTADVASHVAEFEDEGIREQVLEAWIEQESRPLAKQRAEELLDQLKKSETPWSEVLADETITGQEEGLVLSTRTSGRFSWMRTRSVPSQSELARSIGRDDQIAELSTISGIEPIDGNFMKTVFHEMSEGDIRVIPNVDLTVYYVVQVQDRRPTDELAQEAAMNQFLIADLYRGAPPFDVGTAYSSLTAEDQRDLYLAWRNSMLERYDVQFRETAAR